MNLSDKEPKTRTTSDRLFAWRGDGGVWVAATDLTPTLALFESAKANDRESEPRTGFGCEPP
jgi:hypothetical protein